MDTVPWSGGDTGSDMLAGLRFAWRELFRGPGPDLARRRWVFALSVLGMAAMVPVVLLQLGVVRHLPDPPIRGFDSDAANLSPEAFRFGVPDGVLVLVSMAANALLATVGPADRWRARPWLPWAISAKALVDVAGAAWYFHLMLTGQAAWCGYCIVGAFASLGVFLLTLPESYKAAAARTATTA